MKQYPFNIVEHLTAAPLKSIAHEIGDIAVDTSKITKATSQIADIAVDISDIKYLEKVLENAKLLGDTDYVARITKRIEALKGETPSLSASMTKYKPSLTPPPAYETIAKSSSTALSETAETTVKTSIKDSAKTVKSAEEFLTKYKNYIGYSIGGITIATIATIAGVNSEKINNTTYSITSIYKDSSNPSYTIITYTPNDKFAINDTITITNSNSIDPIDGNDIPIYDVIEGGKIKINKSIKVEGNIGIIKCSTNFGNQLGKTIDEIASPVITGTVQAASSITSSTLDTTLGAFGLPSLNQISQNLQTYWWIILLICLIPLLSSFLIIITSQL